MLLSHRNSNGGDLFETENKEGLQSRLDLTKKDVQLLYEASKETEENSREDDSLQLKGKEEEEDFVALEALRTGGVAHLNRKVLELKKLEEIAELKKIKER